MKVSSVPTNQAQIKYQVLNSIILNSVTCSRQSPNLNLFLPMYISEQNRYLSIIYNLLNDVRKHYLVIESVSLLLILKQKSLLMHC